MDVDATAAETEILNLGKKLIALVTNRPLKIKSENLNKFTPFNTINAKHRDLQDQFLQQCLSTTKGDRLVGCMVGMGVADAVGHPFEFLPVVDTPGEYVFKLGQYTKEHNAFSLQRGQWTDDASMGLCIADSLICLQKYNGSDIRKRFWNWWNNGYNNAFKNDPTRDHSVGLGGNISKSLANISMQCRRPDDEPDEIYNSGGRDSGNGSLMRLAPIPVCFQAEEELARKWARQCSLTTHPGPIAAEACAFMSTLCIRAANYDGSLEGKVKPFVDGVVADYLANVINGKTGEGFDQIREMLQSSCAEDSTELSWNWKSDRLQVEKTLKTRGNKYNGYPVSAGYYGAYSMDGLALALHCIYHTDSFESAITRCVNFLGDADSTGSMVGQMAGAIYGYKSINQLYINNLNKWDDGNFALRGCLLYYLSLEKPWTRSG